MIPAAIIKEAQADGVKLALSPAGTIKAIGEVAAVNRWIQTIRQHKPEIVAALLDAANEAPIPDDLENLIRQAGTYWEYSPDDYALVRDLARRDPDGLRLALESDAWMMAKREAFEERAAILEFDAGMTREEAEHLAIETHPARENATARIYASSETRAGYTRKHGTVTATRG